MQYKQIIFDDKTAIHPVCGNVCHKNNFGTRKIKDVHGIIEILDRVETIRRIVSTTLKPNSLGSIIGQFKSVTTKRIRKMGYSDFGWQSRFHDHIIRNEVSFHRIKEYILNNPQRWEFDKYYEDLQ